nr:PREDICTED: deformed epidermal autoregulatory factor 1 homolog [Paralichthys olivaceus]
MDEADSATKALGLDEPPIDEPPVGSDTESEAEVATMAVMAEPGNIDMGAESLPNPDEADAAFAEVTVRGVQAAEDNVFTTTVAASGSLPEHVLSGRTTLQLSEGLSTQKATLIVVHTDGSIVEAAGLKSATAIARGERILNPHAASCTCAACCDDPTAIGMYSTQVSFTRQCPKDGESLATESIAMSGPVRLFVPYKRRKKDMDLPLIPPKKELSSTKSITLTPGTTFTMSPTGTFTTPGTLTFDRSPTADAAAAAAIISEGSAQSEVFASTADIQNWMAHHFLQLNPKKKEILVISTNSSHTELTNTLGHYSNLITHCGNLGVIFDSNLTLNSQLPVDRVCVCVQCGFSQSFQNQISFQQPDDSDAKRSSDITEIIINQMCVNCGRMAMSECTGCHKVNYCSTFCQRKDWRDHQHSCCQSAGGMTIQEEDPITAIDMDKVK